MKRMTDERLAEIENDPVFRFFPEGFPHVIELLQALKAERERIAELGAENTRIVSESKQCHEQNDRLCAEHMELGKRIAQLETERDDARRVMKEACEANRVFVARLDAVAALETLTNGEVEVFAPLHGFDPGFVRADHLRKALGDDDE